MSAQLACSRACLRQSSQEALVFANSLELLAIFLKSIPFYPFDHLRPPLSSSSPGKTRHSFHNFPASNYTRKLSTQSRSPIQPSWLHQNSGLLPRQRSLPFDPPVRPPGWTEPTRSPRSQTKSANCLPHSFSSVPSPTTREQTLRVGEVCTKWRNNRTRPVGGGPVRSSKSITNHPRLSSSSATEPPCPMATQTG